MASSGSLVASGGAGGSFYGEGGGGGGGGGGRGDVHVVPVNGGTREFQAMRCLQRRNENAVEKYHRGLAEQTKNDIDQFEAMMKLRKGGLGS